MTLLPATGRPFTERGNGERGFTGGCRGLGRMEGDSRLARPHSWEVSSALPPGSLLLAGASLFSPPVGGMERGVGGLCFRSEPLRSGQGLASRSGRDADKEPGEPERSFPLASELRALCYLLRGALARW